MVPFNSPPVGKLFRIFPISICWPTNAVAGHVGTPATIAFVSGTSLAADFVVQIFLFGEMLSPEHPVGSESPLCSSAIGGAIGGTPMDSLASSRRRIGAESMPPSA